MAACATVYANQAQGPAVVACTRYGLRWRIECGHRSVLVEHSVGLLHLAVLIANPGQEIPALDLAAGVAVARNAAHSVSTSAQPVLDSEAMREYRRRLSWLSTEIDDFESTNDLHVRDGRVSEVWELHDDPASNAWLWA